MKQKLAAEDVDAQAEIVARRTEIRCQERQGAQLREAFVEAADKTDVAGRDH